MAFRPTWRMIYHVTTETAWQEALRLGFYEAASLHTEGFIHLSQKEQVAGVLDRYYKNVSGLLVLEIEESLLTAPLKYEFADSVQEDFPHLYGRLNLEAVKDITPAGIYSSRNS